MQQLHGLAQLLIHAITHHPPKTDPRCSAVSLWQLSYLFSSGLEFQHKILHTNHCDHSFLRHFVEFCGSPGGQKVRFLPLSLNKISSPLSQFLLRCIVCNSVFLIAVLSVRHTRELWQNEWKFCWHFCAIWKGNSCRFRSYHLSHNC